MTSSDPSSPLDALLRVPAALLNEIGAVFPRFADRTKSQIAFAAAVAEKLHCTDLAEALSSLQAPVAERIADVVPFDTARRSGAPRPIEFEDDDDEALIDVIVASVPPEGSATADAGAGTATKEPATPTAAEQPTAPIAKKAAAKKAPAKVAAKKAPAKAAAKKAAAKKAPAKKTPATKTAAKVAATKAPATATATKTAAKKTAAKKAPARKAPTKVAAKKAPAKRPAAARAATQTAGSNGASAEVIELRRPRESASTTEAPTTETPTTVAPESETDALVTPAASSLAIPNYDALAASQVVPRLASLSAPDLDAVRRYEEANRGRRTILSGIAQIQGS